MTITKEEARHIMMMALADSREEDVIDCWMGGGTVRVTEDNTLLLIPAQTGRADSVAMANIFMAILADRHAYITMLGDDDTLIIDGSFALQPGDGEHLKRHGVVNDHDERMGG